MPLKSSKSYLISAGEFSGDLLAAELVHALRDVLPEYAAFGIAGDTMQRSGVEMLATISELSVMGIVDVARRLNDIRMIESRILAWVDRFRPDFAICVDFPGFHFRLAEQLHLRDIPVYQYVAPKVWAWGQKRVEQLREHFKAVYGVLPFEEEFFLRNGVRYFNVGSPHFDRVSKINIRPQDLGLTSDRPIIAFLPGSRRSELQRILPVMIDVRKELLKIDPKVICVVPLATGIHWDDIVEIVGDSGGRQASDFGWDYAGFRWFNGMSIELMKVANSAVVASGTATLECAIARTPMVVIYAMSELNYSIAKRAVSVEWISLVNLLMGEEVVKEHIQTIDTKQVAREIHDLSSDSLVRREMLAKFDDLIQRLEPGAAQRAAELILGDLKPRGA
jgi:lipid-A-disaccharide synthase